MCFKRAGLFFVLILCVRFSQSGGKLPPPLRIHAPVQVAWEAMLETLELQGYKVSMKDKASGKIQTIMHEYTSGTLTASHIKKIAERVGLLDGDWIRVQYRYDLQIEFLSETETVIVVDTNIRGLMRKFLGGEEWIQLDSRGRLEEDLILDFGKHLFGETFSYDRPRPEFWEQKPGDFREITERPTRMVPNRRP